MYIAGGTQPALGNPGLEFQPGKAGGALPWWVAPSEAGGMMSVPPKMLQSRSAALGSGAVQGCVCRALPDGVKGEAKAVTAGPRDAPLSSLVPRGRKFPENGKNRARLGSALCASRAASRGCSGCFTRCCPAPPAKFLNPCGDCPGIPARGRARGPSAAPPPPSAGV